MPTRAIASDYRSFIEKHLAMTSVIHLKSDFAAVKRFLTLAAGDSFALLNWLLRPSRELLVTGLRLIQELPCLLLRPLYLPVERIFGIHISFAILACWLLRFQYGSERCGSSCSDLKFSPRDSSRRLSPSNYNLAPAQLAVHSCTSFHWPSRNAISTL